MDKWSHPLELLLGIQLPTPVTLATHFQEQGQVRVELMDNGAQFHQFVKV